MPATQLSGGSVKIVDSHTFNISKTIAAAEVTVNPGAMRELHWHPTQDEWSFFLYVAIICPTVVIMTCTVLQPGKCSRHLIRVPELCQDL